MTNLIRRRWFPDVWLIGSFAFAMPIVMLAISGCGKTPPLEQKGVVHGDDGTAEAPSEGNPSSTFPVNIRRPAGPPLIELKQSDPLGRVGRVTCSTCHSVRQPNLSRRTPSDLKQFHQNMQLEHGDLACYACHNPDDSDTLRLADGRPVAYADVMNLCAQCHGTQVRDYARGSHGGMNGYWDLSRGARVRNNCVDCHDPHVPKFPMMQPTFKTRDRFLVPTADHAEHALHIDSGDREAGRE